MQFLWLTVISVGSMFDLSGAMAAILFLLAAIVLFTAAQREEFLLSPVALVIVAYVLGYPLEILFHDLFPDSTYTTRAALEFGMPWALRGFCAFSIGYLLISTFCRTRRISVGGDITRLRSRINYTISILKGIGWLAIISWTVSVMLFGASLTFVEGESVSADSAAGSLQQALSLLARLKYAFIFGVLVLYYWKVVDRQLLVLLAVLLIISIIEILTIGSKASIIRGIVVVVLLVTILPMRLSLRQWFMATTAVFVFYASFVVISEYRSIILIEYEEGRDVFDIGLQFETFGDALAASLPFSAAAGNRETEIGKEIVLKRLSHVGTFSNVLELTNRDPPYEHAWQSFLVPVYSLVPRVLLPDKPEFFHSGRNASEYYGWSYGGVSVTLLGSLYFAWGYVGVVLGMAFLGGLLAYVESQARRWSAYSPHWLSVLVVLVIMLLDVGIIFQAIISELVRAGLVLWALHLLLPASRGVVQLFDIRTLKRARRSGSS